MFNKEKKIFAKFLLIPNNKIFTIFWFPILIPFILAMLGIIGDLSLIDEKGNVLFSLPSFRELIISICKNSNLSFVTTDIWAFSTLLHRQTVSKDNNITLLGLNYGIVMGLFMHIFFYILLIVLGGANFLLPLSIFFFIVGFIGTFLIRSSVFEIKL